ncbi:hypothetical protein TIFTF001_007595, partial [Ficus carica]
MADIILTPIAELIIETLGSAAVKEIRSVYGARDELSKLEDALEHVKAVLADEEKRQIREGEVRVWLQKLEDVLFDADDLVDEVNAEGLRRQLIDGNQAWKKVRTFCSPDNQLFFRHKMAREIKTIWERLDAISADHKRFHLKVAQEIQPERYPRERGAVVDEENVVGREREKMEILKRLMSSESNTGSSSTDRRERVSVIPIIGIGGLGKTTLVQVVYNDKEVEKHFSVRLWVCVSDNVDKSPLIEKVVRSITNASTQHLTMSKLEETVQEKIKEQRFLLILDDVWNPKINQEWEGLRGLLGKKCAEGSRIIVTTRDDMVAEVMGGVQPCRLGHLDSEDSLNLFKKKAFERVQEPADPTILKIAHKIVEKCKGVPLAINMIGSMLCFKDPQMEWSSFLENELSNIPQEEDIILPTLKLSYDYLPSHLKPCFAYCSLFPQDYEFDVHTLVTLWISQGLIRSDQSQSPEKIGHEYFKDLLWRSFFQEAKEDEALNIVKNCKMHDLVHGLAIQVAGEKYAMLDSCEDNNLRKSVRHISFDVSSTYPFKKIPSSWLQGQRIRSFLFSSKYYRIGDSKLDEDISNLKFLRTLDLSDVGMETVPDSVGKLNHLRYLDLSRNDIKTLPASITKLVNLQTLKLNWCRRLCELPRDIEKLVNLRHLELKGCYRVTHMPRGLSQLTNLQTISFVVSSENVPNGPYSKLDKLMGMENVSQEVKIEGIKSGMVTTASKLRENNRLRSLHLNFEEGEDDASKWKTTLEGLQPHRNLKELSLDQYGGSSLSGFLPTLTNLVKLFLENCSKCQQLPSLSEFHSLKEMSLRTLHSLEYITINEGDNYFSTSSSPPVSVLPSLQKLTLDYLPEFRGWWRSGMKENQVEQLILPSFPRLSSLTIRGCEDLKSMPRYPNIEGELELRCNNWKTFEQTSMAEETSSSSTILRVGSDSSYPLSKLTSVSLSRVMDLEYFPDERMKGLASLKRLEIRGCHALKYLSPWILYLTSLEDLHIDDCKEFERIKWPETTTLTRLRVLKLEGLPKLKDVFAPDIQ